jgi:hypothetical protein
MLAGPEDEEAGTMSFASLNDFVATVVEHATSCL